MKILKEAYLESFDVAIFGLGYEERSTYLYNKIKLKSTSSYAIGYKYNDKVYNYKKNKAEFLMGAEVFEVDDNGFKSAIAKCISSLQNFNRPKVFVDITVMSRHRLATALWVLIKNLPQGGRITVSYSVSEFVPPPNEMPPVKEIGPIIGELNGVPSSLGLPIGLIACLGYEENKALGAANYIDASEVVAFIPCSKIDEFYKEVLRSNKFFLGGIGKENTFSYDVHNPYKTFIDMKSVVIDMLKVNRPIILPLGPKIVAALSVLLGIEFYPHLPIWRLSSKESEVPVNRPASGHVVNFTIEN
ncbi:hypothetical protein MHM84_03200 [Halomonas sp. McH1-25]|uniref:hypothetical protein n=1 Tax=unclassified Halomonas TaxID=2609666 RepID=UPI001EF6ACB3|nr:MULTISPECIES: hypothetical protein [unclassified Halomonas]MCG7598782.1 hypothetical protein [Halomonas sp. McH1-25]MCP1340745.1 hypothetical protein [Halomonas sp. FL8]MCP1359516.1 hypothetical protein [Halomonas sp. BBD45]MCP1363866.1 hypothetical protein [Halomonas sp. BBD48]